MLRVLYEYLTIIPPALNQKTTIKIKNPLTQKIQKKKKKIQEISFHSSPSSSVAQEGWAEEEEEEDTPPPKQHEIKHFPMNFSPLNLSLWSLSSHFNSIFFSLYFYAIKEKVKTCRRQGRATEQAKSFESWLRVVEVPNSRGDNGNGTVHVRWGEMNGFVLVFGVRILWGDFRPGPWVLTGSGFSRGTGY